MGTLGGTSGPVELVMIEHDTGWCDEEQTKQRIALSERHIQTLKLGQLVSRSTGNSVLGVSCLVTQTSSGGCSFALTISSGDRATGSIQRPTVNSE